jgi:hypothetical protein
MNTILAFISAHQTTLALAAGWLFSAFMSSMPALPPNASYFATWFHDFAQIVAANINRRATTATSVVTTPTGTIKSTSVEGPTTPVAVPPTPPVA